MTRKLFFILALCAASLTGFTSQARNDNRVTFTKEIAPILYQHCAQCHRPDEAAPFSVLRYQDVRPWAKSIREKVVAREMPPWHADAPHGQFSNDARLTQAEIDAIAAWVDSGAPEGNPKNLPPAPKAASTWAIGEPDAVLQMPQAYTLAAQGTDDYIYFRVPTHFTEDKWIQAAEFLPGNRPVVHHALVFVESPSLYRRALDQAKTQGGDLRNPVSVFQTSRGSSEYLDGTVYRTKPDTPVINDLCASTRNSDSGGGPFLLMGYAPGKNADVYPTGTAKRIPAGANLIFQMHYAKTTGQSETDRTSVALRFARQPVEKLVESLMIENYQFAIPPGAAQHTATACYTLPREVELMDFTPHMHVRGKAMKYEVIYPDGKRATLLNVPRYDFNWQTLYMLSQPLRVPQGARLMVTATFDNSAQNKRNPDPTKTVRFGEPTYDEMLIGFVGVARPKPPERPVAKLAPETLAAYEGVYSAGLGPQFTIRQEGGTLYFIIPGQLPLPATPESATKFYFRDVEDAEVVFSKTAAGDGVELQATFGQQKIQAKKRN
ncbi:MAG: c-type cytochrome [Acidobacteria bacterium]|nr:c-type cytochrome [Acidobacteriota bacterium]MBI3426680.1 c-type cytochrome [Acidobacteriota bacterium]